LQLTQILSPPAINWHQSSTKLFSIHGGARYTKPKHVTYDLQSNCFQDLKSERFTGSGTQVLFHAVKH